MRRGEGVLCVRVDDKRKRKKEKKKSGAGRYGGRDVVMCFLWDLFLIGPPLLLFELCLLMSCLDMCCEWIYMCVFVCLDCFFSGWRYTCIHCESEWRA